MSADISIRTVTHTASGASIRVHPYGATVLSYVAAGGREILFVSNSAVLDGSKPVRGGIPLVFPIFGPAPEGSTMPQHGFARRNVWSLKKEYDDADSAGIMFELNLKDVDSGRGEKNMWEKQSGGGCSCDCTLQLTVDFSGSKMSTLLVVQNTGETAFPFQALLHTYYKVDGNAALKGDQCYVKGLKGYEVADKVSKGSPFTADGAPITISSEVDRVYTPPKDKHTVDVTIGVGGGKNVKMTASGAVDGRPVPVSCVVWNPHKEKASAMSDFGNEQYHEMVCVEPGILGENTQLEPGKNAVLSQVINVK